MHIAPRTSKGVGALVAVHHCGQPDPLSGHSPWTTRPKLPLLPEHCAAWARASLRGLQNSGYQLSARV